MEISVAQARDKVLSNAVLLQQHLLEMAGGGSVVTTDLAELANSVGLDENDVRVSAAALMIHGQIVDILPAGCGRMKVFL